MDILTHYMAGYFLSRRFARRHGATASTEGGGSHVNITRAITLSAVIPDIDFVFMLFGYAMGEARHRGFTHSIVVVAVYSLFFFIYIHKAEKGSGVMPYIYIVTAGIWHCLMDLVSLDFSFLSKLGLAAAATPAYLEGIRMLWPLSFERYSVNSVVPGWAAMLLIAAMFIASVAYLSHLALRGERPWAVWTDPLLQFLSRGKKAA